jgi:hypothetical protein
MVQNHPYRGGFFSGVLRDGKPFNGRVKDASILYKTFSGDVVDGALTYPDRSRLPVPGVVTPFQRALRGSETPFQRLETRAVFQSADETLRRNILNLDVGYQKLSVDEKFSVNNDNQRRLFDTVFGREMISRIAECEHSRKQIRNLSDKILLVYKVNIVSGVYVDWQAACAGTYCGKDSRFQQLMSQNQRVKEAVEVLEISADAKNLLVDIYQRRYLNYLVDETDLYKSDHPVGILKSKTDPFYFKRGRLDGDFACRDSLNMGILRSIDKAPGDLRFAAIVEKKEGIPDEIFTRCPDRLNMADPSGVVDRDADSWLTYNFLSGNTPYVNGLSGSMLIEIRGMLYLKEKLAGADSEADFLSTAEMVNVLDDYFRLVTGLYVYVDGGHSLFEIQSSFKQKWVKGAFISTFEGAEWGEIGQDLYSNLRDFERAYRATKQFDKVLQNRESIHSELALVRPDIL